MTAPSGTSSQEPGSTNSPSAGEPNSVERRIVGAVEVLVADEQTDVDIDTDRWLRLCVQVLAAEGVGDPNKDIEMSLLFVDEATIAVHNERFMGKVGPTDVLSFPIDEEALPGGLVPSGIGVSPDVFDSPEDEDAPLLLGDVLICPAVALQNAPEHIGDRHNGTLDDELALLVVHGILHLLGMDHMVDDEAEAMEAREQELLDEFYRLGQTSGTSNA